MTNIDQKAREALRGLTKAQRECFELVADEHPLCIPAEDERLVPFCDNEEGGNADTINQCFSLGIINQVGSGDFDDFRIVLTPLGLAVRALLQTPNTGGPDHG